MHPSQCIHVDQFLYNLAVLGLDKVGKGLGLLVAVVVVAVVVVLRSDVLHLVDAAALGASLNGALAVHAQPGNDVRVGGVTSATGVLLITSRLDHDGVVQSSFPRGVQGAHVEDVNTLHLSEDFETLETGGLLEIGRDGTGGGTRSDKVVLSLDIVEGLHLLAHAGMGLDVLGTGITADDGGGKAAADNGGDGSTSGDGHSGS